jgi:hypothetical protein
MATFLFSQCCSSRSRLSNFHLSGRRILGLLGHRTFSQDAAVAKNKTATVTLPEAPGKEEPPQHAASTGSSQSWSVSSHGLSEDQKDFLQVAQVRVWLLKHCVFG